MFFFFWGGGGQRFEISEWLYQAKAKRPLNRSPYEI